MHQPIKIYLLEKKGQILMGVVIAAAVISTALFFYQRGFINVKRKSLSFSQRLLADLSVSELAEFFRSQSPAAILNYLAATPTAASPYPLCAHINIMDRAGNHLVNRDDLAALGPSWLDSGATFNLHGTTYNGMANRFYQVFVVDASTMQIVSAHCNQTAAQLVTAGGLVGNEKLLVAVGVSWIPKSYSGDTLASIVNKASASVLIPGTYP